MKTAPILHNHVITGTLCTGAILFSAATASAQNLYEADLYTGAINEFNSAATQSTFVPSTPLYGEQIAFNSAGDLFVGNGSASSITEIAPNGTQSSFGFGFNNPTGVAINNAGDVFVASRGNG